MTTVDTQPVLFAPDARQGALQARTVTLGAANAVTSVAIPFGAIGFKLRADNTFRFAIDEDPGVLGASLTPGGTGFANETEVRTVARTASQLRLASSTAALVLTLEFF